jgi:undecaprenyl-diphosphatase
VVLGIVQGLTEFLPVSSSGHLIMVPFLLGWSEHSQAFDLALHVGTLVALFWYFWRDWVDLARAFFQGLASEQVRREDKSWRMAWLIVLGCLPAGVAGIILEKPIEELLRGSVINAVLLITFGALLLVADRVGSQRRSLVHLTWRDAFLIGAAQVLALMPGVSRSGITMTAGLFRDLDRAAAARFSFLLSGPITLAAAVYKLREGVPASEIQVVVIGAIVSAVTGWLAIGFLLRYLQRNSMMVFVVYRFLFGAAVLLVAFSRGVR